MKSTCCHVHLLFHNVRMALTSGCGMLYPFFPQTFPTVKNVHKTNLVTQNTGSLKQATSTQNVSPLAAHASHQGTNTFHARRAPTWAKSGPNAIFGVLNHVHLVAETFVLLVAFGATSRGRSIVIGTVSLRKSSFGYRTVSKIDVLSTRLHEFSPSMNTRA